MSQLATLLRARPNPRCPACHKWNRVYVTGGSFLSECVHCGATLEVRRPPTFWGVIAIGISVLLLAAAIPLLAW